MDIQIIDDDKSSGKLSFALKGTTPSFANMLRKFIIDEVPTMAIEDVEIRKNNSILYDEILAHRLGLLPLKTDLKSYILSSECKCNGEGCAKCTVILTLKAKGPGIVYASEMKSKDPKIIPVHPKTPIVKLIKGQNVEVEATAMLGQGKVHAKWSPALAYYKYHPVIEIKAVKNPAAVVDVCPKGVFEVKGTKLVVKNLLNCHLCGACADLEPTNIKLNESDTEFVFYVESWGQLPAKEIVETAIERFQTKIKEFTNQLK